MFQEHKAVSEALRDYATFSSEHFSPDAFAAMMAELPEEERVPAPVPIAIDPPLHTKLRHPLSSTFSPKAAMRSEEHTSELQSLMRISYDVFCLKKNTTHHK